MRLREAAPRADAAVQVEDEVAELTLVEPLQHRVDRGSLLGDEQDRLVAGDQGCDQVRDRLALAGAGRPADDQALAARTALIAQFWLESASRTRNSSASGMHPGSVRIRPGIR